MKIRFALVSTFAVSLLAFAPLASATTVSTNTGSLGAAANGTNADAVTFTLGAVAAGGDLAAVYANAAGVNTIVPFLSSLNPASTSPFTIEFWAKPSASDNDDAQVSNRLASVTDRSGWVFFQRAAATGWNFRMYNGVGGNLAVDITGGTATLNAWSHVVVTWSGTAAVLYVNGVAPVVSSGTVSGTYNPNTAAGTNFIVGSSDTGSPTAGAVDEVAFYAVALSAAQILNHFNTAASATPGAYQSLVRTDGARLQLSNIPEPSTAALIGVVGIALGARRSRKRQLA
jgi:hypothetical protein